MQIYTSLEQLDIRDKTSVALGNFDGFHIGHVEIMKDALAAAEKHGLKSLCFTFSNHPFNFILRREEDDPAAIKMICSEQEKVELVRSLGFDILVNVPFDETVMKMRAHDFFRNIITGSLNAGWVSVGFNYTYGARAEGKPADLVRECFGAGIGSSIHDAVMMDGKVISSTLIRGLISEGDMEHTAKYLGRPYTFAGKVIHGNQIGSSRSIPTANIAPPAGRMLPPRGVYFSRTLIDGNVYTGVSNLGVKPTIGSDTVTIETNLFDFGGDLYDKEITVCFDHFSRPERKFASRDELFDQIARDCKNAGKYYNSMDNALSLW